MNQEKFYNSGKRKPLFFLFMVLMVFIFSAIVMLLWNAIIPDITGWKEISYWQSMGLLVLCKILCGSFGKPMNHGRRPPFMMRRIRQKFANATPEERAALKEEWRNRCRGRN